MLPPFAFAPGLLGAHLDPADAVASPRSSVGHLTDKVSGHKGERTLAHSRRAWSGTYVGPDLGVCHRRHPA